MIRWILVCFFLWCLNAELHAQSDTVAQSSNNWLSIQEALSTAKVSGRPILVDVYAPWCPWCARLQEEVYPTSQVSEYIEKNFEIARLNIDDEESVFEFKGYTLTSAELASGLGAQATPTTVFLSSEGDYITRLPGFLEADEFIHVLRYIGSGAFQSEPFKEYRARQD